MTSPSDDLRQAAAHIREVAGETAPGPWRTSENGLNVESDMVTVMENFDEPLGPWHRALPPHIALWDPDVAELIAKMLDAWAKMVSLDADFIHRIGGEETLAMARAILAKAGVR